MKTEEVAEKAGVKIRIVQRWASQNGVFYTGEGRRKDYVFSIEDFKRFLHRPKPGRPLTENDKNDRRA
jgi:DNA-binding transcriptional MerR regulator